MIWPHDRSGLSLISFDLSRRGGETEVLWGASLSQSDLWLTVDARPEQQAKVSGGADPCRGPGGESHCQQALMASKIPQLTKTCEQLGNERHL